MRKSKHTLSLVLSIVLTLGLLPVSAMAKEVNTLVLNAVCLFSSTKGEATEFTFTTGKAGVYRFDLKDTNPKTHGGHLKLYSGSDELNPYSADYIYYGDMQPHISQSWNLNANTTYRLTHTPDEDVDPNTTHHYSLKPTYAGVPVNPVLSAGQSAQIKFLNVGGGCEDYYVAHFNVRVAMSGFYRIDSTNRSYISTWGQLPQTVYFKNGKDYSFSANPASQSSAPANDTITLTAVQADCKTLTETSPVSLTEDGWISFTAPSAGTYCFEAQDSEGYLEFITAVNDETFLAEYQQEELIQELEHFSMQSGETVYFYVQHATPGPGQMTVTKVGGSTEPDPTPETLSFVDVPSGSYYYDAVLWAVKNSITTGTDAIHFSPDGICTRAQAVTFLWRAAGSPAPKSATMPFTDVPAGSYYYNAVLWAVENGITKGASDAAFSPDKTCTRAQIVTFLWRSQNAPAAGSSNPFTDVAADDYYADAVLWAVKENVTKGTGYTMFGPDDNCPRAQIVTFLWRTMA